MLLAFRLRFRLQDRLPIDVGWGPKMRRPPENEVWYLSA
jgi:hypothetical protein